jgi:hypothetical protein
MDQEASLTVLRAIKKGKEEEKEARNKEAFTTQGMTTALKKLNWELNTLPR